MRLWSATIAALVIAMPAMAGVPPQNAGTSGTVDVLVTDPSGAVIPGATVKMTNPVTGYQKTAATDATGAAHFTTVPPNPYHVQATMAGFQPASQDVQVRSSVPVNLTVKLQVAAATETVEVHSEANDILEPVPSPHTDVDSTLIAKLPTQDIGQGITDVLSLSVPGVVKDSNGFIHPLGDHAETQYSVDNQPITNQQNKQASNQFPVNAFQSFEAVEGGIPPEYGDKASLVVNAITRSALSATKPFGSFSTYYGSFGQVGENASFGIGTPRLGNFFAANSQRSGRYLDTPEFEPMHDIGNSEQFFDRFDYLLTQNDTLHANFFIARSWFQIPNTYDQQFAGQDQRQQVRTIDFSPGWVHLFGATTILTVTPYFHRDRVQYFPSRDIFSDQPATIAQDRTLEDAGLKADVAYVHGIHNAKAGV